MTLAEHIAVVKAAEASIWAVAKALDLADDLSLNMTCYQCAGAPGTIRALLGAQEANIMDGIMASAIRDDADWEEARELKRIAALPAIEQRRIERAKRRQNPYRWARMKLEAEFDRDLARKRRRWLRTTGRQMPDEAQRKIIMQGIAAGRCGLDKLNRSMTDACKALWPLTSEDVVGIPKLKEKHNG